MITFYFYYNSKDDFSIGIDDRVFDIKDEPDCDIHEDCEEGIY